MDVSEAQRLELQGKLDFKIGDPSISAYDHVRGLIPYEIRDPESAAAVNRAPEGITDDNSAEYSPHYDPSITDRQYKNLLRVIDHLKNLSSGNKHGINRGVSETTFEHALEIAGDTLLEMIKAISGDLGECAHALQGKSIRRATDFILNQGRSESHTQRLHQESAIEAEQSGLRDLQHTTFQMTRDNLDAVTKMFEAVELAQGWMKNHRRQMDFGA